MAPIADSRLREISDAECLELLKGEQVGRIAVVVEGCPQIFPVNYALDASGSVILRTAIGTKLAAAVNHHVAFEVDRFDAEMQTGWSVVVHGVAHQTTGVAAGPAPLGSWLADRPHLVRIAHRSVSGRRLESRPISETHFGRRSATGPS